MNDMAQPVCRHGATNARTRPMLDGRRDDTRRRRRRVLAALDQAAAQGGQISAAALARTAGVDRTVLYRHRDLLDKIHALQADPIIDDHDGPAVTRASLQADLLAAHERTARLDARIRQLEKRLSEALGAHLRRIRARRPPTSTRSTNESASSNNTTSTFNNSSTNATTTWPPPAPPTENSWPD